jgi:hypothetical protein
MDWLINHFIPLTNSHGSHLTADSDRTYTENNIIPVCMLPHSSHLVFRTTQ